MLNPGVREEETNSTRRRLRGKQRNLEEVTRRNQDHEEAQVENRQRIPEELTRRNQERETAQVESRQRIPEELAKRNQDHETVRVKRWQRIPEDLTRRNQDHETARVESRQRALEDLTMKDKGRGKMRMRGKQSAPDVWMVKERETEDVQPQEERNESASSSATGVSVREQQHQMPSHVQIFIPDRGRRIKIVPPKPPREKKKETIFKGRGTGKCTFCGLVQSSPNHRYFCDQAPWEVWCKGVQIRSAKKYTDRQRDAMRYACQYCHHKCPDGKLRKHTTLHALAGGSSQVCL